MSLADDCDYLEHRAEAELELAQHATDPRAVQVHYDLANAYLDRIHGENSLVIVTPTQAGVHAGS